MDLGRLYCPSNPPALAALVAIIYFRARVVFLPLFLLFLQIRFRGGGVSATRLAGEVARRADYDHRPRAELRGPAQRQHHLRQQRWSLRDDDVKLGPGFWGRHLRRRFCGGDGPTGAADGTATAAVPILPAVELRSQSGKTKGKDQEELERN